jgi:antitoxin CptB
MTDGQDRLKILRWKSRRGMKELDVLLEAFLATQAAILIEGGWPEFEEFLAQEDDVLLDWISGRNLPTDSAVQNLIKVITNAA